MNERKKNAKMQKGNNERKVMSQE